MGKNTGEIKLANRAYKLNNVRGIFNSLRAALPLNKKSGKFIKATAAVLTGVILWIGYNTIDAALFNSSVTVTGNNFEPGNIFDTNGNDITFDENGSIVEDDTTQQEIDLLKSQIVKILRKDANSRCEDNIYQIDKILSFSFLPNNDYEKDNEFDKYRFSVLISANNEIYSLNYDTGKTFSSNSNIKKEILGEFGSYLRDECGIYTCCKMSEIGKELAGKLDATFVGESYEGYVESGLAYYYIPVFTEDSIKIFRVMCTIIDGKHMLPLNALYDQIVGQGEQLFEEIEISKNENLTEVLNLLESEDKSQESSKISAKANIIQSRQLAQTQRLQAKNLMKKQIPTKIKRPELEH